jgi:hypothetical protein
MRFMPQSALVEHGGAQLSVPRLQTEFMPLHCWLELQAPHLAGVPPHTGCAAVQPWATEDVPAKQATQVFWVTSQIVRGSRQSALDTQPIQVWLVVSHTGVMLWPPTLQLALSVHPTHPCFIVSQIGVGCWHCALVEQ